MHRWRWEIFDYLGVVYLTGYDKTKARAIDAGKKRRENLMPRMEAA